MRIKRLMFLPVLVASGVVAVDAATAHEPRVRTVVFDYEVTVPAPPPGSKTLELWFPVPHDDAYQKIRKLRVESDAEHQIAISPNGNRMFHLLVNSPVQGVKAALHFEAERIERIQNDFAPEPASQADADIKNYLLPSRLVPLDGKIREWASEVVERAHAKTDLEKARAIYEHVVSTVKYDKTGTGWGRGDIYYACDSRRGNCTDFHAIFIGYARAIGVPARFAMGFPLPRERGSGRISGYHCWAEFYAKGIGWIPVDASEAAKDPARRLYFFGAHDENRIQFSRDRDLVLTPLQAGPPLNFFIYPYAEVDGKEFQGLETGYHFQDVAEISSSR